jgi:hypothetical protein
MDITPAFYINLPASADFGLLDLAADQSQMHRRLKNKND